MKPQVSDMFTEWVIGTQITPRGNFIVYALRSKYDITTNAPMNNFWWKGPDFGGGVGPFPSEQSCIINLRTYLAGHQQADNVLVFPTKENVVYVDFKAKKRIV